MPHFHTSAPANDLLATRFNSIAGQGMALDDIHRAAIALHDEPEILRGSLSAVTADPVALNAIRTRSSVHPNGFAKLVLHAGDAWSIRLHVWPQGRDMKDVNPHGHRWVFASWIVTGVLREVTFDESPTGDPFDLCDYARDSDDKPFLMPVGKARLAAIDEIERPAGTVYARSRSVLHTAEPLGRDLVASLVFQGRKSFTPTPVYLRPGTPAANGERELSADELTNLLAAVTAAIT